MITNNLNSRETKILNSIQIAFNDFSEKIESVDFFVDMKTEFFRAVWYVFKKDGSYEIIDFVGGFRYDDFYEYYSTQFNNDDFDFSIKICDYLYLLIVNKLKVNQSKITTKDLEDAMKEICFKILTQVDNKIYYLPPVQYFYSNGNNVTVLTSEELKKVY